MTRITVVGSFAVGLTIRTETMPVFGQTIIGSDFDFGPGGKGSNQAVGAARLGAEATLVTCLGRDQLAGVADQLYAAEGVKTDFIERTGDRATGAGIIVLNADGENFIILDMGANELMDAAIVDRASERIATSDIVMSVLEIPVAAAHRAMEAGKAAGARTILNPAPAMALPDTIFAHVDYLTPNESELRILLGLAPDDPTGTQTLAAELRRRGVGTVVATMGENGALVLGDDIDLVVPTPRVDAVDTTGAGDAFNAGLAVALGEGRPLADAVAFGAAAGAHACTRLGVIPSLATGTELETFVADQAGNHAEGPE
ncbi:ribokinase [Roseitalea porphyridii]|uniref:Ribokinase n=1 Tax=Roseitalea porphyridii TaxID=1852022 RepID=A0A4P6V3C4_9HYPH|nr:ribokinase [Roseitalea porphyridii]QBK32007.1 ribokinase [Roseitalea porphyridii]